MIVGARDPSRAAVARVEQADLQPKARQIDGRREAAGPAPTMSSRPPLARPARAGEGADHVHRAGNHPLPGDVPGTPLAIRSRGVPCGRGDGAAMPSRCAISPPTSIVRSTTRRRAAAPAWCCAPMWWRARSTRPPPPRPDLPVLALTPRGSPLTQARVRALARGRARPCSAAGSRDSTRGCSRRARSRRCRSCDYILSGGEMGALVLLDACVRLLPG